MQSHDAWINTRQFEQFYGERPLERANLVDFAAQSSSGEQLFRELRATIFELPQSMAGEMLRLLTGDLVDGDQVGLLLGSSTEVNAATELRARFGEPLSSLAYPVAINLAQEELEVKSDHQQLSESILASYDYLVEMTRTIYFALLAQLVILDNQAKEHQQAVEKLRATTEDAATNTTIAAELHSNIKQGEARNQSDIKQIRETQVKVATAIGRVQALANFGQTGRETVLYEKNTPVRLASLPSKN